MNFIAGVEEKKEKKLNITQIANKLLKGNYHFVINLNWCQFYSYNMDYHKNDYLENSSKIILRFLFYFIHFTCGSYSRAVLIFS